MGVHREKDPSYEDFIHHTNLNRANTINGSMSTSFQVTSTGTGQSVISVAKSATESGKPGERIPGAPANDPERDWRP